MSIVWIYREMRSGSTAFSDHVARQMQRKHLLISADKKLPFMMKLPNPQDFVFSTHEFSLLEQMQNYSQKPILIRCARRNKLEQILSYIFLTWKNKNRPTDQQWQNLVTDKVEYSDIFGEVQPANVQYEEVIAALYQYNNNVVWWNNYSTKFISHVIYYEDLCSGGVSIPELNIESIRLHEQTDSTKKLPSYKNSIFLNIPEVEQWIIDFMSSAPTELAETN